MLAESLLLLLGIPYLSQNEMSNASDIILNYVCPGLGAVMASAMFAAPVGDLKKALASGGLGALNPLPWVFMTGNCLGWSAYGYYTHDPFVVAGNIPGLVLSIWLNLGAIKIQYYNRIEERLEKQRHDATTIVGTNASQHQAQEEEWDADVANEEDAVDEILDLDSSEELAIDERAKGLLVAVPHERSFFQMVIAWVLVLVWVGWIWPPPHPENTIGIVVNVNLVFFYGAPLQTLWQVMRTGSSESIHRGTMFMNWCNTSFWLAYAVAQRNYIIGLPNFIGLLLGIAQGVVCLLYPRRRATDVADMEAIPTDDPMEEPETPQQGKEDAEPESVGITKRGDGKRKAKWTMV